MKLKAVSGIMVTLLLIGMLTLAFNIQQVKAEPKTIYVDASNIGDPLEDGSLEHPFDKIQEGINVASSGETVFVYNGTYYEHVVVSKSLILVGENRSTTVIDGSDFWPSVVEVTANNVSISGFTIQNCSGYWPGGPPPPSGILLNLVSGCNITGNTLIKNHWMGLTLYNSSGNILSNNSIAGGCSGIPMYGSSNNIVSSNTITNMTSSGVHLLKFCNGNTITNNYISLSPAQAYDGICIVESSNNIVTENIITDNYRGISLHNSTNNMIYHNSFINNKFQADINPHSFNNTWDNGYPSGGNYWSDYTGVDVKSGPNQDQPDSDGIGDTPYVIDANNTDRYPLITTTIFRVGLSTRFGVIWEEETYYVDVISNSTVEKFQFKQSGKLITFNVTGPPGTIGYCNVTIPKDLLKGEPWAVLVDGSPPTPEPIITFNTTHTSLYFTYSHSQKTVEIIGTNVVPEFPTWTSMLLILILLAVAIAIHKRRLLKIPIH